MDVHDWLRLQHGLNCASDAHEAEDAGDLGHVMERGAVAAGGIACFASGACSSSAAITRGRGRQCMWKESRFAVREL